MRQRLTPKTPAAREPASLEEVKRALNVPTDFIEDDAFLTQCIAGARAYGEQLTGGVWVESGWELGLDRFPSAGPVEMGVHPVHAVGEVAYLDTAGVWQTLTEGEHYQVIIGGRLSLGEVWPAYGRSWPAVRPGPLSVRIGFTAGWPIVDDAPTTPLNLKLWLYRVVAGLYAQREPFVTGTILTQLPNEQINGFLDPYTLPRPV